MTLAAARRSPGLDRLGVALRDEAADDLGWLAALYAGSRADELSRSPLPPAMWPGFLAEQFRLQRAHYLSHHPGGERMVVTVGGERAGRLYLDRTRLPWRLIDITIDPIHQRRGIGAALIRWLQREGRGAGIDLHVVRGNAGAARFYARLGFLAADGGSASHARMLWPAQRPARVS